jgi:predicted GNAT family acetyltransferase
VNDANEPPALAGRVVDNREAHRFEFVIDGKTAVLDYERTPTSLVLVHTQVPPSLRGRHIADTLAKAGIGAAHTEGLEVVAKCHFVKAYLRKHPQLGQPT